MLGLLDTRSVMASRGLASQLYPPTDPGPEAPTPDSLLEGQQQWLVRYTSQPSSPSLLLKQLLHVPEQVGIKHTLFVSSSSVAPRQAIWHTPLHHIKA